MNVSDSTNMTIPRQPGGAQAPQMTYGNTSMDNWDFSTTQSAREWWQALHDEGERLGIGPPQHNKRKATTTTSTAEQPDTRISSLATPTYITLEQWMAVDTAAEEAAAVARSLQGPTPPNTIQEYLDLKKKAAREAETSDGRHNLKRTKRGGDGNGN